MERKYEDLSKAEQIEVENLWDTERELVSQKMCIGYGLLEVRTELKKIFGKNEMQMERMSKRI